VDVDFEGQLLLLVGNVLDFPEARLMGCIVDENVDPAELGHCFVDNPAAMPGILDVLPGKDNLAAALFDKPLSFSRILVLVQVSDRWVRSFPGKGDCDGTADAAVAAGDDRFLSSEPARSLVRLLAIVGTGFIAFVKPGMGCYCSGNGGLGCWGMTGPGVSGFPLC
jgi:hypothetical protein